MTTGEVLSRSIVSALLLRTLKSMLASLMEFFEKDYSGLKYYRPGQIEALQALVTKKSPEEFWANSAWDISDPSFRQIALLYYQEQEAASSTESKESLELDEQTLYVKGNLSIEKNLIISDSGSLVVLGNLEVGGNIVVASDYPSLYVADKLSAKNLFASQSEIMALTGIDIENIFALKGNHTVLLAPQTRTKISVLDDAFPDTTIESQESFPKMGAAFFKAMIDSSFEDTHTNDDEYYEMLEEIDEKLFAFFRS